LRDDAGETLPWLFLIAEVTDRAILHEIWEHLDAIPVPLRRDAIEMLLMKGADQPARADLSMDLDSDSWREWEEKRGAEKAPAKPPTRDEMFAELQKFAASRNDTTRPMVLMGFDVPIHQDQFSAMIETKGQEWKAAALPPDVERGEPSQCFMNATHLMMERPDLDYCEGIAYSQDVGGGFAFLHAWCVDKDGTVIDPTWAHPEGSRYFGVKYDRKAYLKHIMRTKLFGVVGGDPVQAAKVIKQGGLDGGSTGRANGPAHRRTAQRRRSRSGS